MSIFHRKMRTRFCIQLQRSGSGSWSWNARIHAQCPQCMKVYWYVIYKQDMLSRFRVWITMRCNLQIYLFISHRKQYLLHISFVPSEVAREWAGLNGCTSHKTIRTIHLPKFSIKFVSRGNEQRRAAEHIVASSPFVLWGQWNYNGQTAVDCVVAALKLLSFAHFHGHKYGSRSVGSVCSQAAADVAIVVDMLHACVCVCKCERRNTLGVCFECL